MVLEQELPQEQAGLRCSQVRLVLEHPRLAVLVLAVELATKLVVVQVAKLATGPAAERATQQAMLDEEHLRLQWELS